jgi:uncharacterized protein (TIGR03435 family)
MAAMRKRNQEGHMAPGSVSSESWPSVTTKELAARLMRLAGGPVIDETGLNGNYSVTIKTSKSLDGPETTVFDAVEKLGLKLEPRKVTIATVVVDQISKTPTPN